jgi:nitroimidazol reductase NimA-like FMN-containing flavoprotein (pyridoxamine 5'-phosphate oxidase superfamily)
MRKANREIIDLLDDILTVIKESDVCRIGLYADGQVYIVPLSFGFDMNKDGCLTLYFHCANEGRKLDMIAKNPHVCFEMDTNHRFVPGEEDKACGSTMIYSSLIGNGYIEILNGENERIEALSQIMRHYSKKEHFEFDEDVLNRTTVLKLTAHSYTGKFH